jgi:hypothetical protein
MFKRILLAVNQSNQCIDPNFPPQWSGYWIAKRRLDVYATDQNTCLQSPFVWVKDNTTNGLLPEQSWESTVCFANCAVDFPEIGMIETCCHFAMFAGYTLNDCSCWYPHCPLCQMDANWWSWLLSHMECATLFFQNRLLQWQKVNLNNPFVICINHHMTNNFWWKATLLAFNEHHRQLNTPSGANC